MPMLSRALPLVLLVLAPACAAISDAEEEDAGEGADEGAIVALTEPDETAPASALEPADLDAALARDFIDLRGVGDSGWSTTHEKSPIAADFGKALDRFDASGKGYRGDLSFINWETVVGNGCTQFASVYTPGRSYAFVSRPANLVQANERGFNLVGLSNNHTRDCVASADTALQGEVASSDMTTKAMVELGDRNWLWAGVVEQAAEPARARVRTFQIKGKAVRVAFGSLYTGRESCPRATCAAERRALFESLRDAAADLRIVAMHSKAAADQDELVRAGQEFVKTYGGDVVFGHGPHVWKPVRVVRKDARFGGGTGVVFESLGNFLHPALAAQSKNFIGRALFDARTFKLRQVQVLPITNSGRDARWSSVDGGSLQSNLRWSPANRGVYANIKP